MQCEKCNTQNRDIAKFCKQCGATVGASTPAISLGVSIDELVGLDDLKKELQELQSILEGMKQQGSTARYPYNAILIGNSGTAKTLVSNLITELFMKFGMITKSKPVIVDGEALENMPDDKNGLQKLFDDAKGSVLFVDNSQKLVDDDGNASAGFQRLITKMDQHKDDPIVIMAGLPFGFREFVKNPKFKNITGRFQKIFIIADYTPPQYVAITEFELKKQGFTVNQDTSEKLLKRYRFLFKDLKKPDTIVSAVNGYLAMNEARLIIGSYFSRKGTDKTILPDDIKGKIEEKKTLQQVMEKLDSIIGMTELKKEVKSLYTQLLQIAEKEKRGFKTQKPAEHFIITGNPGTGKTTVARLLGEIFEGMGLLESGHVIEVDRGKLVAEYVGQTAPRTNKACDDAMGGILFIDEAYALVKDESDTFGNESVVALLKRMEDDRGKFILVIAGYKTPIEKFLTANDGFKSRFTKDFDLADYTPDELNAIFIALADEQQYIVPDETKDRIINFFKDRVARKTKDFANGREARNLLKEALKNQSARLANADFSTLSKDDVMTLLPEDIPMATSEKAVSLDDAMKELNLLVGLSSVKDAVKKISDTLEMQKIKGTMAPLRKHFVFQGNPGTGKTTVARIMADVFKALGMLPTNNLIEVDRSKLVAQHVGGTGPLVNSQCDSAMGGILFIDEAYAIKDSPHDSFGQEAINILIKRLEDDQGKYVCILAGYTKNMATFLSANPGFKSRVSDYITFEDYTVDEMFEIFSRMCKKNKLEFAPGFEDVLRKRLEELYGNRAGDFGNARTVRKIYDKTGENLDSRIMDMKKTGATDDDMKKEAYTLRPEDMDYTVND